MTCTDGIDWSIRAIPPGDDVPSMQRWASCSVRGSPGATACYQQLRNRNIGRQAALRQLTKRLGILHS